MSGYNYGPSAEAGYGGDQSYEMQPQGRQQPLGQDAFLTAVGHLRESISQTLGQDIQTLNQLQSSSLRSSSPMEYTAQIDQVRARFRDNNNIIRDQLAELFADASATPAGGLRTAKERQLGARKQELKAMTQQMLQLEKSYQEQTHQSIKREYMIANQVTEQEADQRVPLGGWREHGGAFAQALAQSSVRTAAAQNSLRSLQSRATEMQQIEDSIAELAQMFDYMDQLVVQQNDTINQIEQQADQTVDHLVEANKHQTEAIKSARSWRKYKWWCLLVVVLILIAIAVGVAVGVTQPWKTTGN